MESFFNTYKNKKVLITGHTGFKGSWLAIWLHNLGAKVSGYALDPENAAGVFTLSLISEHIEDHRGDIRDREKMEKVFYDVQPEIVFHLAAQPLVIESYKQPLETFEVNTQGTVNILEAIRKTRSVKAAIMITSDKCYENREWLWGYREDEPMGGYDPYSASKGAAELAISAYRRSFLNETGIGLASARAGNVIGGGDWSANRLIPDVFRAIEKNQQIEIRNSSAVRPWQHVLEPLSGYLLLGHYLFNQPEKYSEAWNFGPYTHEVYTVGEIVEKILMLVKDEKIKHVNQPKALHEAGLLMLDITKAIKKLKWKPQLTIDETLELTSQWYLNYSANDVYQLTVEQIKRYQNKWIS